ncbi:hypothetical protein GALL_452190 [mine drainage metagenome]|uniref:Uncharacterized protein n=1 Tax=mine drainage metagenome TaxID=410659 RepID=A0A1J5PZW5_9ZZZZ
MDPIAPKGTDRELRVAATAWINLWQHIQENCDDNGIYVLTDEERNVANAYMDVILTVRATTYEGICAKAAVLTALDGNSDRLAVGLCADIQRIGS